MRTCPSSRSTRCGPTVRSLLLPIAAALLLGAGAGSVAAQALDSPDELRLRAGDLVRIMIKDEPTLSGDFPVNDDGRILVSMAGLVEVAGRRFGDVRAELHVTYAEQLVDPVIVITPLVRIAVLGEVRRPGVFPVDPSHSLADVLATVGGLTPLGHEGRISLVRDGEVVATRLSPGADMLAVPLRSGDQIVVGRLGWWRENMPVLVGAAASVAAAAITSFIIR